MIRWKFFGRISEKLYHYCILTDSGVPSRFPSKDSQDLKSDRPNFQSSVLLAGKKTGRIDLKQSTFLQWYLLFKIVFQHSLSIYLVGNLSDIYKCY